MLKAVLDTSAVASGIGWSGAARSALVLLARRAFQSFRTPDLTAEWFDIECPTRFTAPTLVPALDTIAAPKDCYFLHA